MSDDDIANIYDAVMKEHIQLAELYSRTDDMNHLITNIMHTDNLIIIINNAVGKLSSIGINIFKQEYNQYYNQLNAAARYNMMPSIDTENKLIDYILSNKDSLAMTISNYNSMYLRTLEYYNNEGANDSVRGLGGGILGGAIAGLAFGPIGAIIGGIATGSFVGDKSREYSVAVFRNMFESLNNEFKNVYCDLGEYLDEMIDRLICAVDDYRESLQYQRQLHY